MKNTRTIIFVIAGTVVSSILILIAAGWGRSIAVSLIDARCRLAESRRLCLDKTLVRITKALGPAPALSMLSAFIGRDASLASICHVWGHHIGFAAVEKLEDPIAALKAGIENAMTCGAGYIHGVLVRSGANEALKQKFYSGLEKICEAYDFKTDRRKRLHCVHGLGHGLLVLNDFDLPKAIKDCEKLPFEWDKVFCSGGVFMENASSEHTNDIPPYLHLDDPFYPCTIVNKAYQSICFHFTVGDVLLRWNKMSIKEAFDFCSRTKDIAFKNGCYKGVSRIAFQRKMQEIAFNKISPQEVAAKVIDICKGLSQEGEKICYLQIAGGLSEEMGNLADYGGEVCRRIPDEFKSECFFVIGLDVFRDYSRSKESFEEVCRRIAGEWFESCMLGVRSEMAKN
jgi:hypothetical protein